MSEEGRNVPRERKVSGSIVLPAPSRNGMIEEAVPHEHVHGLQDGIAIVVATIPRM